MANNVKLLNVYNGNVGTTATSVYTPSNATKSALITSIQISSSAAPTVTLELTGGGSTSLLVQKLTLGAAPITITDVFTIGAGEKLEIKSTSTVNAQFTVMGIERD